MGRSLEDFPEQSRKCPDCGKTTWETEHYACDCQDKEYDCEGCGEPFEKPYADCRDHKIADLERGQKFLREVIEVSQKANERLRNRIAELESCVRYKEGHIEELQAVIHGAGLKAVEAGG